MVLKQCNQARVFISLKLIKKIKNKLKKGLKLCRLKNIIIKKTKMKISYNATNKNHLQILQDYFFFKNYYTVLKDDWSNFYFDSVDLTSNKKNNIIKKHLNEDELKRFLELYDALLTEHYGYEINHNYIDFMKDLFYRNDLIKIYKLKLKNYFKNQ